MITQMREPAKLSTGVTGLDAILNGGLPRNRTFLLQGIPGTGKTTLGLEFLLAGRDAGERALDARAEEVRRRIGQDLHDRVVQGILGIKMVATNLHKSFRRRGLPEAASLEELADLAGDVNLDLRRSINELVSARVSALACARPETTP